MEKKESFEKFLKRSETEKKEFTRDDISLAFSNALHDALERLPKDAAIVVILTGSLIIARATNILFDEDAEEEAKDE